MLNKSLIKSSLLIDFLKSALLLLISADISYYIYFSRNFSPYQSRRNDVYNFRVIATINELHSPIARSPGGKIPEDLLDRADNLFPIVAVFAIRADDRYARRRTG